VPASRRREVLGSYGSVGELSPTGRYRLEYKLAIGTVAKDGNRSFTEMAFTTLHENSNAEGTDQ